MNVDLYKSSHLCALARELAEVASHYRAGHEEDLQFSMYSEYRDGRDEIYVVLENADTGKKWQFVRVALAKLSEEERNQLHIQIATYNQSIKACTATV